MLNPPADLISPLVEIFARFDVASFYDSIDHAILLSQLEDTATPLPTIAVVSHYLTEPDITHTVGSISPLLGALYLKPLDDAFSCRDGIFYWRYMDDVVILAKTRWKLRHAIRIVHQILSELKMQVHETKRFIGRSMQGFDFLGYTIHPFQRLRPSDESIRRLQERAHRLWRGSPDREALAVCIQMVSMALGRCVWEGLTKRGSPEVLGVDNESTGYS